MKKLWFLLLIGFILAGCQTTGNPKAGGLWGWSEQKAIERQKNLQMLKANEENKQRLADEEKEKLNDRVTALDTEKRKIVKLTYIVENELKMIDIRLKELEVARGRADKQLNEYQVRYNTLVAKIDSLKNDAQMEMDVKARMIEALDAEVEELLELAELL